MGKNGFLRSYVAAVLLLASLSVLPQPNLLAASQAGQYRVPLQQGDGWEELTYNRINANRVSFSERGLRVAVNQSASPLIYAFAEPVLPAEVSVALDIEGDIQLNGQTQGDKGADDFVFRLGLVTEGDRRLNFMQRAVAADWIKKLHSMAPDNSGIDQIQFYNVYSDNRLAGQNRIHPLSDLMVEHFISARPADGKLQMAFQPDINSRVLALWISIDGDDTKSAYEVLIRELVIKTR